MLEGDYFGDAVKRSGCYVEGVEKSVGIWKNVGIGGEVSGRSYWVWFVGGIGELIFVIKIGWIGGVKCLERGEW